MNTGSDPYGGYVTRVPIELSDGSTFALLLERTDGLAVCEWCSCPCYPERFVRAGYCEDCGQSTHVAVVCGDSCAAALDWKQEDREAEGGH